MQTIEQLTGAATYEVEGGSYDTAVRLYGGALSKVIKQALVDAFPGVAFSVTGSTGTARGWFSVKWTDGPSVAAVDAIVGQFESSRFNGMVDGYDRCHVFPVLVRGRWVIGTSCGINTERTLSDAFVAALIAPKAERYGWTLPTGSYTKGEFWGQYPQDGLPNWQEMVWQILDGRWNFGGEG